MEEDDQGEDHKEVNTENEMDVMQIGDLGGKEGDVGEDDDDDSEDGGTKAKPKKRVRKTIVSRSKYWSHFEKFMCPIDKIQKPKCKYCGIIIKADPKTQGTTPIKGTL